MVSQRWYYVREWGSVLLILLILTFSCQRNDPFIGCWEVDKVNVEFNENLATPEMVRQYGEMEQSDVIEIGSDSLLTFVTQGDTLRGRLSLRGNQLFVEGSPFGIYKDNRIVVETPTPMGKVTVFFRK